MNPFSSQIDPRFRVFYCLVFSEQPLRTETTPVQSVFSALQALLRKVNDAEFFENRIDVDRECTEAKHSIYYCDSR